MSKRDKLGKIKIHSTTKYAVKRSSAVAASALSTIEHQKTKTVSGTTVGSHRVVSVGRNSGAPAVAIQAAHRADPSLLEPYDWGPDGIPEGKPIRYVLGQGFIVEN